MSINSMQLPPEFFYRVDYVGNERQRVLVIDNFLIETHTLIEFCASNTQFNNADVFYPGVRAPAPERYLQAFYHYLRNYLCVFFY